MKHPRLRCPLRALWQSHPTSRGSKMSEPTLLQYSLRLRRFAERRHICFPYPWPLFRTQQRCPTNTRRAGLGPHCYMISGWCFVITSRSGDDVPPSVCRRHTENQVDFQSFETDDPRTGRRRMLVARPIWGVFMYEPHGELGPKAAI